jgi:hypothetical protein
MERWKGKGNRRLKVSKKSEVGDEDMDRVGLLSCVEGGIVLYFTVEIEKQLFVSWA